LSLPQPPLLVVTDRKQAKQPLYAVLAAAFAAGCRWASMREKDLPPSEQIALLRSLLPVARAWQATLTVHGEPAIADEAGADGVHLPAGGDASAARTLLGRKALIGMSIHSLAEAAALDPDLVDYAIAGPVFASASKPGYGPVLGSDGLRAIADASKVPVIAIGGITPVTVPDVVQSRVYGIALMGAVMRAADVGHEMRRLLAKLDRGGRQQGIITSAPPK
jgi:thiamine-phosphate pyrophosphorylase